MGLILLSLLALPLAPFVYLFGPLATLIAELISRM